MFIAYLDEAGTASLSKIDPRFPSFGLGFLICDVNKYINDIVPPVTKLKMDTFGHDAVILHTTEMRNCSGDFSVLLNQSARNQFYSTLNGIIANAPFELIAVAIRKTAHSAKYGKTARDPYELALEFGIERLTPFLDGVGQKQIVLVAESRSKEENAALDAAFHRLMKYGSFYQKFSHINFQLRFAPKSANSVGHQLADICINPIARYAETGKATRPYQVACAKIMQLPKLGLKFFP